MTRRRWLARLSWGAASTVMAAACAGPAGMGAGGGQTAPAKGPMTIRHMPWEAPKDIQAAEDVAKAFNQKNGRVTVKVEPAGGPNYDKLTALFAASQAPETFYLQGWLWQQYAVRGMLLDLAPGRFGRSEARREHHRPGTERLPGPRCANSIQQ